MLRAISNRSLATYLRNPLFICLISVIALLQIVNLITTSPNPNATDGQGYMAWGKEIVAHHRFDPSDQFVGDNWYSYININGKHVIFDKHPIGWSLCALPGMFIGQELTILTNHRGFTHYGVDGDSPLVSRGGWVMVYLWTDVGLICGFIVMCRLLSIKSASWAAPLVWLGTSAYAYTWRWPYMSHGLSLACLCILTLAALEIREGRHLFRFSLVLGIVSGLLLAVRLLNIFYLVPIWFLALVSVPVNSRARTMIVAIISVIGCAVPLFVQALCWKVVYGAWYFNGYAFDGEGFAVNWVHLAGFLLSSHHGLFFMHPITILCLLGLGAAVFDRSKYSAQLRQFFLLCFLGIVANIFLYGFWSDYHLGDSFGARWVCDGYIFWTLGLGPFFELTRFSRRFFATSGILAMTSFVILTGQVANRVGTRGPLHIYMPTRGWMELP